MSRTNSLASTEDSKKLEATQLLSVIQDAVLEEIIRQDMQLTLENYLALAYSGRDFETSPLQAEEESEIPMEVLLG